MRSFTHAINISFGTQQCVQWKDLSRQKLHIVQHQTGKVGPFPSVLMTRSSNVQQKRIQDKHELGRQAIRIKGQRNMAKQINLVFVIALQVLDYP